MGFRFIASTVLHEMGFNHAHIELQLAHQERDQVSAVGERRECVARVSAPRCCSIGAHYLENCTTGRVIVGKFGESGMIRSSLRPNFFIAMGYERASGLHNGSKG